MNHDTKTDFFESRIKPIPNRITDWYVYARRLWQRIRFHYCSGFTDPTATTSARWNRCLYLRSAFLECLLNTSEWVE